MPHICFAKNNINCKTCTAMYMKAYYKKNKAKILKQTKEYYKSHRVRLDECKRLRWTKLRQTAIRIVSGKTKPTCKCCKLSDQRFLTIDHVYGGGRQQRKNLNLHALYSKLANNKLSLKDYQILCMNCNWAKGIFGTCPHKSEC